MDSLPILLLFQIRLEGIPLPLTMPQRNAIDNDPKDDDLKLQLPKVPESQDIDATPDSDTRTFQNVTHRRPPRGANTNDDVIHQRNKNHGQRCCHFCPEEGGASLRNVDA